MIVTSTMTRTYDISNWDGVDKGNDCKIRNKSDNNNDDDNKNDHIRILRKMMFTKIIVIS